MESIHHCSICAEVLPEISGFSGFEQCGACLSDPPFFNQTQACFVYEPLIASLIQRLKFSRFFNVLPFLVQSLEQKIEAAYLNTPFPDCIIPLPLQKQRQFWRGFNQSHEIGGRLAKRFNIQYQPFLLKKKRKTEAQAKLSRSERQKNVKNSFEVKQSLEGKSIAIVDDVMTTGSTLREAAKVLHSAGAGKIHVWVLARALNR